MTTNGRDAEQELEKLREENALLQRYKDKWNKIDEISLNEYYDWKKLKEEEDEKQAKIEALRKNAKELGLTIKPIKKEFSDSESEEESDESDEKSEKSETSKFCGKGYKVDFSCMGP